MNLQIRIYRKSTWQRLVEWWQKPPARLRVLAVLRDAGSEMRGLHINQIARCFSVYHTLAELQDEGLVESREASDDEIEPLRFGKREIKMRLYRLTPEGFRVARGVSWCP